MASSSIPGVKDSIALSFRTVRIGTLRTFPIKINTRETAGKTNSITLSSKGIKFPLSLKQG